MSDTTTLDDRPYPFEVKTVLLQLFGVAISTPKDVADINIEYGGAWGKFEVRVYVGGYDGKTNSTAQLNTDVWLEGKTPGEAVKLLEEVLAKINGTLTNGRKVKADRLREQANELLRKATEIEGVHFASSTQT